MFARNVKPETIRGLSEPGLRQTVGRPAVGTHGVTQGGGGRTPGAADKSVVGGDRGGGPAELAGGTLRPLGSSAVCFDCVTRDRCQGRTSPSRRRRAGNRRGSTDGGTFSPRRTADPETLHPRTSRNPEENAHATHALQNRPHADHALQRRGLLACAPGGPTALARAAPRYG